VLAVGLLAAARRASVGGRLRRRCHEVVGTTMGTSYGVVVDDDLQPADRDGYARSSSSASTS
jgi:hypothetical protein